MTQRDEHIGCIDGRTLTVRRGPDEVVLGIGGSDARLSLDAARLLALRLAPPPPSTESPQESRPPRSPYSREQPQRWERIVHLIEAELLSVGAGITLTHHGQTHHAKVTGEGSIEIDGQIFDSPSPAAEYVTKRSCNGWQEWRVVDGPLLIDLRWKFRARTFLGDNHPYAQATIDQKRSIARRWVDFALARGLDPGKRDDAAVEDLLGGHDYVESTLSSYRSHLEQWFEKYDSPQ